MRPAPTCSSTRGSRSTPMTSRPRSAKESAKGRPIRPSPTIATRAGMTARLAGVAGRFAAAALAQELPPEGRHEARVVVEVAREEPSRLLGNSVGPLETALLHPLRRLGDPPAVEVERRPH